MYGSTLRGSHSWLIAILWALGSSGAAKAGLPQCRDSLRTSDRLRCIIGAASRSLASIEIGIQSIGKNRLGRTYIEYLRLETAGLVAERIRMQAAHESLQKYVRELKEEAKNVRDRRLIPVKLCDLMILHSTKIRQKRSPGSVFAGSA